MMFYMKIITECGNMKYKKEFLEYYLWNVKWFLGVNPFIFICSDDEGIHRRIRSCLHDLSSASKFLLIDKYLEDEKVKEEVKIYQKNKGRL